MNTRVKFLLVILVNLLWITLGLMKFRETVDSIKITKEIKIEEKKNLELRKKIAKDKLLLNEKVDLKVMKKKGEEKLKMHQTKKIEYVRRKK